MKIRGYIVATFAGALLAGAAVWRWKPTPAPTEPVVVVPDSALLKTRPTLERPLGKRLTTERAKPQQIARTAGRPDTSRIAGFCAAAAGAAKAAPAIVLQTSAKAQAPDTVAASPAPPAQLPPFAGRFNGRILEIHSTLSDGNAWRGAWRVHTPVEWLADGDTVAVTQPRAWVRLLAGAKRCGLRAGVGSAAGVLLGFLVKEPVGGAIGGAAAGCASGI